MLKTVEGFYRDGKIDLAEMPGAGPEASPVLVTFLDEAVQGIQRGVADVAVGNTRPLSEFEAEMRQKYGISG
jgi:hypothetical protein